MSTISATHLSSLALAVLVSFDLNITIPVCASSAVVKGVEEGNVVLRPGGTTVVCVNLAVEEWVEKIVEKAAVEGIEVVVIRTVVVLVVVVTRTVVVLGVVVVRTVVVPVVVVICSVVDTVVGRLVVRRVVIRSVVVAGLKVVEVTGEGRSVVVVVGRTVVLRVVGFTVVGRLVVRLVTGSKVVVLTVGRLVVVVVVSRLVVEEEVTS